MASPCCNAEIRPAGASTYCANCGTTVTIANLWQTAPGTPRETCCGHVEHVRNGCLTGGCACTNPSDPRNQEVTP